MNIKKRDLGIMVTRTCSDKAHTVGLEGSTVMAKVRDKAAKKFGLDVNYIPISEESGIQTMVNFVVPAILLASA